MFMSQARIPVDLMYGTAEPGNASYGDYAMKLQEWLIKAYKLARESLTKKQERQTELYNKKSPWWAIQGWRVSMVAESPSAPGKWRI